MLSPEESENYIKKLAAGLINYCFVEICQPDSFSDIPMHISRANSWKEASLISTGQLSSLNRELCRLVSLSTNCGTFSEVWGAGSSMEKKHLK
jgi:hypothetical protein